MLCFIAQIIKIIFAFMIPDQIFRNALQLALTSALPGLEAHLKLAPSERIDIFKAQIWPDSAKASAVMIVLFQENNQIKILFILRSLYDGVHSGQISFPGGQKEETDNDLLETAMRETLEEVGLQIDNKNVIGKLSDFYIPNSNFIVAPFVAFIDQIDSLIPDCTEVQEIYKIPLLELLDEKTIQLKEVLTRKNQSLNAPCFFINGLKIWGATAMILNELVEVIKRNDLTEFVAKKNTHFKDAHPF